MSKNEPNSKICSGLFWKFGERFSSQGISFLVSIVLSRLLSPDDYGVIALVMTFMALADVFVISGFNAALIQKRDATNEDFSTLFYCSLACALLIYGLLFAFAPMIAAFYRKQELVVIIRVLGLRVPLSAYNSIQTAYASRHMLFRSFFFSTLSGTIISAIIGIGMAYLGMGVWALVAQYISAMIVNTVVLGVTLPWRLQLKFSWTSAKRLMNYGWKVFAADFLGTFFNQLRSLIIGRMYAPSDLAYYDKGQQFPNLLSTNITTSVMAVLFPAIANVYDDEQQVRQMTKRAAQLMSYITYPIMVGLAAVAPAFILSLFGSQWEDAVPFLQVLAFASAFGMMGDVSLQSVKAIGRSDVILRIELWKKPVYFILLILGVRISVFATAVTMVLYSIYAAAVNMWQLKKYIHYGIFQQLKDLAPAAGLALLMGILVTLLGLLRIPVMLKLILQVIMGALIYVAASVIFKVPSYVYLKELIGARLSGK